MVERRTAAVVATIQLFFSFLLLLHSFAVSSIYNKYELTHINKIRRQYGQLAWSVDFIICILLSLFIYFLVAQIKFEHLNMKLLIVFFLVIIAMYIFLLCWPMFFILPNEFFDVSMVLCNIAFAFLAALFHTFINKVSGHID